MRSRKKTQSPREFTSKMYHFTCFHGKVSALSQVLCVFPVRLHLDMIACSSFEKAKVFVNVQVTKALPRVITFKKNGKEFTAEFIYPWLPRGVVCVINRDIRRKYV